MSLTFESLALPGSLGGNWGAVEKAANPDAWKVIEKARKDFDLAKRRFKTAERNDDEEKKEEEKQNLEALMKKVADAQSTLNVEVYLFGFRVVLGP